MHGTVSWKTKYSSILRINVNFKALSNNPRIIYTNDTSDIWISLSLFEQISVFSYDLCCNSNILSAFVNLIYKYFIYRSINGVSELTCIESIYSFIRHLIAPS